MNINYYNPYVRQELELYHHGVAGQKWGKKNGPPYPLSASAHSASEKKAGWRKSLNGASRTAKAVGRGAVKVAKATRRGLKKVAGVTGKVAKTTAHLANKGLLALDAKPAIFMTDKEIQARIDRLKLKKSYTNALKGKFGDVTKDENSQNKGKEKSNDLLAAIGKDVLIPTTTGTLNYMIAKRLAKDTNADIDIVRTIMGKNANVVGSGVKKKKKKDRRSREEENDDGNDNN